MRSRIACTILRCEWPLWGLLVALAAASLWCLPRLELAFGFKSVMQPGQADRMRLEAYEREFRLGDSLLVYFQGAKPFTAAGLKAIRDLEGRIERLDGIQRVFSAVDLLEPALRDDHLRLVPILGAETLASESKTRECLASPPFSDRWFGYLYDRAHSVYTLIIRPQSDQEDPKLTLGLLERIEAELIEFRARTGIEYHLNGLFYLNGEMVRSTFRDQGRLTLLGLGLLIACFWGLWGSLPLAVAVMGVLAFSILLAFGVMYLLGVPLNGLSGNLPVLTLVNGLEDVVHLLVLYFATRKRAGGRRAAAESIRQCLVPNFLTSLTTFGALIFTGVTDMALLQSFGYAICIGVVVEYVVAIVYLPLILSHVRGDVTGAFYYRLDATLATRWLAPWAAVIRSRWNLIFWAAVCVGLIAYSSQQRINANWYRYFVKDHPVSQSLELLRQKQFPVTTVDCTISVGMTLDALLTHPEIERDLDLFAQAIRELPGVVRVDSWANVKRYIDSRMERLQFESGLAPHWRQARREAFFRQYLELGAFDEYYSAASRKLRLVVSTTIEDADGLLALSEWIVAVTRSLATETLHPSQLVVSGSMAYWGAIMGYVSKTFFVNIAYSLLFILAVFIWVTRSVKVSLIAMVPNVMPIFVMFATARVLGYDLFEGFCVIDSLAIGNSVNDTIHYIFHVDQNVKRGTPLPQALSDGFREVGCAMVISSLLVAVGFLAPLAAEGKPLILTGVYMCVACVVAVAMDVFMHPSMLLRLGCWPGERKP